MSHRFSSSQKRQQAQGPVSSEHLGTYTPPSILPLVLRGTVVCRSMSCRTIRDRHSVRGCTSRDVGRHFDLTGGWKGLTDYTSPNAPRLPKEPTA
jgi:hypothetical protein